MHRYCDVTDCDTNGQSCVQFDVGDSHDNALTQLAVKILEQTLIFITVRPQSDLSKTGTRLLVLTPLAAGSPMHPTASFSTVL